MKEIPLIIIFIFLMTSFSCSHFKRGNEIHVKYEYDIRLYRVGDHWENKESLDDSIRYLEKNKTADSIGFYSKQFIMNQLTLIDSVSKYNYCYKDSVEKEFKLVFTGLFNETNVKIYSGNKKIFNNDLTTNMSCGCSVGFQIDKKLSNNITIKISNHQPVELKLDYRFNRGYIWYDGDNVGITFTNYHRILD